jgi:hypothetical protein
VAMSARVLDPVSMMGRSSARTSAANIHLYITDVRSGSRGLSHLDDEAHILYPVLLLLERVNSSTSAQQDHL